nr:hypothetical protein [Photorhabdus luminescens]
MASRPALRVTVCPASSVVSLWLTPLPLSRPLPFGAGGDIQASGDVA